MTLTEWGTLVGILVGLTGITSLIIRPLFSMRRQIDKLAFCQEALVSKIASLDADLRQHMLEETTDREMIDKRLSTIEAAVTPRKPTRKVAP